MSDSSEAGVTNATQKGEFADRIAQLQTRIDELQKCHSLNNARLAEIKEVVGNMIPKMYSALQEYVPNASQRNELGALIHNGVKPDDPSLMVLIRGGTDATRRVLTDAITAAISHSAAYENEERKDNEMDFQVVYFCCNGGLIASTRGAIYISASGGEKHSCSESCLAFVKSKGHPVLYIDCGRMQTETQLLQDGLEKLAR